MIVKIQMSDCEECDFNEENADVFMDKREVLIFPMSVIIIAFALICITI